MQTHIEARATSDDGHWRVVDKYGRRYMRAAVKMDNVACIRGLFVAKNTCTEYGWDIETRFTESEALLLAGAFHLQT